MTDIVTQEEVEGEIDYFDENFIPPTEFGSRLPPIDIVPETTEGDDNLYILMVPSLVKADHGDDWNMWPIIDVANTACLAILLQFQQDILMRTKITETKMKRILKSQESDFLIDIKARDKIFEETYPVEF